MFDLIRPDNTFIRFRKTNRIQLHEKSWSLTEVLIGQWLFGSVILRSFRIDSIRETLDSIYMNSYYDGRPENRMLQAYKVISDTITDEIRHKRNRSD
jgi:hypothetical protein